MIGATALAVVVSLVVSIAEYLAICWRSWHDLVVMLYCLQAL